ncbi:MAG: FG-GAP-like repeat-containing protein [Verrucomicrobiaceae bacterium]
MKYYLPVLVLVFVLSSCKKEEVVAEKESPAPGVIPAWELVSPLVEVRPLAERTGSGEGFVRISGDESGIDFENKLEEENVRNYLLNGAGMAVADYDQDGLPDLFLVCQDGPNKLYRQVAPWKFEDVTTGVGILDQEAWGSGATFADMDNDGHLDLIVCNKGKANEFYQSDGKGRFIGGLFTLAEPGNASPTIAAPADYDRDGDLDLYIASNRLLHFSKVIGDSMEITQDASGRRRVPPPHDQHAQYNEGNILIELGTPDLLVRNDGGEPGQPPKLGSVAYRESGMSAAREHGLAAVWFDVNNDLWPDLYVSNDFSTPDHLYLNKGGSFDDVIGEMVAYTSFYSMGSDFADVNNDGHFDYFTTDMSSTTHYKQKTMMGPMENSAWFLDNLEPRQQMRNVLHVNTGTGKMLATEYFSHLDSTDWTWSALFGDLDNDGFEDLYITNGMERNIQNADMAQVSVEMIRAGASDEEVQRHLRSAPRLAEKNLAFRNEGDLHFEDVSDEWGLVQETVSHGAVLADLDRDGDLDIVANGMNEPLLLLRNDSAGGNAVLVSLVGKRSNRFGLGARITAYVGDGQHTRMMTAARGYASSGEPVAHLGLGEHEVIDRLVIQWPSGAVQTLEEVEVNRHYRVSEPDDAPKSPAPAKGLPEPSAEATFVEVTANESGLDFVHEENEFNDFSIQPLLPNKLSHFGPALASGDLNGDGLVDIFVGGAAGSAGQIFLQKSGGVFERKECAALVADAVSEDVDAVVFDADGDGDADLYVVSGGNRVESGHVSYRDRLYLNDGGEFVAGALPDLRESGGAVAAADVDQDGDLDLFVGSRIVPQNYPLAPLSRVLLNDGKGGFVSGQEISGMVTDARFVDVDGDSWEDLVLTQEWGCISIWRNVEGELRNIDATTGLAAHTGWWNGLGVGDIDGDGDPDFVATNFGVNNKYHATPTEPALLLVADFGGEGRVNLVEAIHEEGKVFPVRGKSCSTNAMPFLAKKFPTYHDFALADINQIYDTALKGEALELSATTLESQVVMNNGDGTFALKPLPGWAQLSPAFGSVLSDFNKDGHLDLVLAQNFFHPQRETGRMNSSLNLYLKGDGAGNFTAVSPIESGLNTRDDSRNMLLVPVGDEALLISAPNGGPLRSFRVQTGE